MYCVKCARFHIALLAQLVEQTAVNRSVAGSIPVQSVFCTYCRIITKIFT